MRFLLSVGISAAILAAIGAWPVLQVAIEAPHQLVSILERAR